MSKFFFELPRHEHYTLEESDPDNYYFDDLLGEAQDILNGGQEDLPGGNFKNYEGNS